MIVYVTAFSLLLLLICEIFVLNTYDYITDETSAQTVTAQAIFFQKLVNY